LSQKQVFGSLRLQQKRNLQGFMWVAIRPETTIASCAPAEQAAAQWMSVTSSGSPWSEEARDGMAHWFLAVPQQSR
jgi:hypothetical protein